VSVLNAMGGDNYRSVILTSVNKVLRKNVAALYSTFGMKGKNALNKLRLHAAFSQ
jgi:hypothetical protein